MSPRSVRFVLVSSFLSAGAASCSLRVGSGGPPPSADQGNGQVFGTSACARVGAETKLAFGAGADAFAFAWDTDHYVVVYPDSATGDIFAGAIAADGTAMGSPVNVQATPAKGDLPSILKTTDGYVVAWQENSAGNAVVAHALNLSAQPVGGASQSRRHNCSSRDPCWRTPREATLSWRGWTNLAMEAKA